MSSDIPDIEVKPARRTFWQRASVVWVVPLGALLIALGIAWQTWSGQGPLIVVTFDEALGVKARETDLKYRDVTVGQVERVEFTDDLGRVRVSIRLDKNIAPFVDSDAAFWVVRPEVSARGVSGLDTVLSGVFIEGVWDTDPGGLSADHEGFDRAPLLRPGESGSIITLLAQPGTTLTEGAPILYKGIEVGQIGTPEIRPGTSVARAEAVVFAPYDRLISTNTRFWDTSGFTFSIGASGANLDFSSLASLVAGGVSFDTVASGGLPVQGNASFELFASEQEARAALFSRRSGTGVPLSIVFEENATGLTVGSPVQLNGIGIGEVTGVSGIVDALRFQDRTVRLLVNISVDISRLGLPQGTSEREVLSFFESQIEAGLRARLATASILTGGLRVELITVDNAPEARLDMTTEPYPTLPVTESVISDATATAQGVLERINALPIEALMQAATDFLEGSTALVTNGDLAAIPGDVRAILGDVRGVTGAEQVQAIPEQVTAILADVQNAARTLDATLTALEDAAAVERLLAAVDSAAEAGDAVSSGVSGVPALIESLTQTADRARDLPLEDLVLQVTQVVASADALLTAPGADQLPANLNASLEELRRALQELREGGAVESLNATLASAEEAAAAVEAAAQSLPEILRRLNAAIDSANVTLEDYDANSDFNRAVRQALAEVASAAKAIESLSRSIERRPNSIILGR